MADPNRDHYCPPVEVDQRMSKDEACSLFRVFADMSIESNYHVIEARTQPRYQTKLKKLLEKFIRGCPDGKGLSQVYMDQVIDAFVASDNVLYCFSECATFGALSDHDSIEKGLYQHQLRMVFWDWVCSATHRNEIILAISVRTYCV